jgi:hypothetical protein
MRSAAAAWLVLASTGCLSAVIDHEPQPRSVFVAALGDAGTWGAPYGWLGPRGAPVWEEYRKNDDQRAPPYPAAIVVDAGADGFVQYDRVRQGFDTVTGAGVFVAPGLFIAPGRALESPGSAVLSLGPTSGTGYDLRLVFAEHLAANGGASLRTLVSSFGGDDGSAMDPYYGSWGVDGLFVNVGIVSTGQTWQLCSAAANLVAASSTQSQMERTDRSAQLDVDTPHADGGLCNGLGGFDLGTPSTQPLPVSWALRQSDAGVQLRATLGPAVSVRWLIDDGASRRGLTDPGNGDAVGYQGGALDLASLVPAVFVGAQGQGFEAPLEGLTMGLKVSGAVPVIDSLQTAPQTGVAAGFVVTARDQANAVVAGYGQTVVFTSTDGAATLPAPFTFTPQDMGSHAFEVTFGTEGPQSIRVAELATPAIGSEQRVSAR